MKLWKTRKTKKPMNSVTGGRRENHELENENLSYASRRHRHSSLAEQELNRKTGSEDYHHV